jgi:hypothetical protein
MKFRLLAVTACMVLSGCYASCATGDPLGLFTYCPKESYEALMHPKPYGVHWIKDGMTRDQRRQDSWSCGADTTVHAADYVVFSKEKKASARLPSDQSDYGPDDRLTKQWESCMRSRNYVYLHQCDARCLYP